ncbi:MAG: hypothetical protein U5L11_02890 [Arhodomonas sp.]|nr:hypothetical protein [Arhodomonas sp.]
MQRFLIALVLAVILAGTAGAAEHEDRHLLTVITDDSTQTQAMALILTRQWVKDGGSAQILLLRHRRRHGRLRLRRRWRGGSATGHGPPADASAD